MFDSNKHCLKYLQIYGCDLLNKGILSTKCENKNIWFKKIIFPLSVIIASAFLLSFIDLLCVKELIITTDPEIIIYSKY